MDNRNLERAMDIVSMLITGEQISEQGENAAMYQEYNTNSEVYDIVHLSLKKMNLKVYEYNNGLFVSPGENNRVFGYSNEELRKELGIRLNRELYLSYFIIYHTITEFYSDTISATYAEFVRVEDIIRNVDHAVTGIIDKKSGFVQDEILENSFKQIAMSWDELPVTTVEDQSGVRAARNSKSGFVKMVFNFMVSQDLLVESQDRYYPTDRFKALIENYFDDFKGRFAEILEEKENDTKEVEGKEA
jgi:replicative superfamily II helicase